jgi:hypothetical protein
VSDRSSPCSGSSLPFRKTWVVPASRAALEALTRFRVAHPGVGQVPVFPQPRQKRHEGKPVDRHLAAYWLNQLPSATRMAVASTTGPPWSRSARETSFFRSATKPLLRSPSHRAVPTLVTGHLPPRKERCGKRRGGEWMPSTICSRAYPDTAYRQRVAQAPSLEIQPSNSGGDRRAGVPFPLTSGPSRRRSRGSHQRARRHRHTPPAADLPRLASTPAPRPPAFPFPWSATEQVIRDVRNQCSTG